MRNSNSGSTNENMELVPLFGAEVGLAEVIVGGGPTPVDRMRAWTDAFEAWMENLRAENTRRAYRAAWRDFLAFADKMPWEVGKSQVAEWAAAIRRQGLSDATLQQRLAALSSFYSFTMDDYTVINPSGREVALHDYNPAASGKLRPKISPYGKAIYLSAEEARALLWAIKRTTVQGLRDYALFLAYLATGRRNSEIRMLRWGDFERNGGRIWYRWSGKGKDDMRNECPARLWEAIVEYLKAAGRLGKVSEAPDVPEVPKEGMRDEEYIFTALTNKAARLPNVSAAEWVPGAQPLSMREVGRLLKRYARLAGLDAKKIHVHTLRHTAAMLRHEAGDNVEEICAFLAHSSLAITQIYLHRVEGKKDTSWSKVEALLGL
ncbi:MAG: hypothetical protein A2Z49_09620 [Chloroflexi bacterium RBG_19FT_COMBO_56_12]|nr:MAG: hypothetical protein A2Z49_09620 [Chloroflexi bacterium RBG_19FT_COMBO_56_12]